MMRKECEKDLLDLTEQYDEVFKNPRSSEARKILSRYLNSPK